MLAGEKFIFDEKEWQVLINELSLTPRQGQVVRYLLVGKSDKQIARDVGLAVSTVRVHLRCLFARFGVHDRTELVTHIFYHFRNSGSANNNHPDD